MPMAYVKDGQILDVVDFTPNGSHCTATKNLLKALGIWDGHEGHGSREGEWYDVIYQMIRSLGLSLDDAKFKVEKMEIWTLL